MTLTYRPPLWSQNAPYSAADDRRLPGSVLISGVVGTDDLRVVQRQEGANLSVDVLPGEGSVKGTDQANQGHYVCPLATKVNIPITGSVSSGQRRVVAIVARVIEHPTNPAIWECQAINGAASSSQAPPWPALPNSSSLLAIVGPIESNTGQITQQMILDQRRIARPAPLGGFAVETVNLGRIEASNSAFWYALPLIRIAEVDWPVDILATFKTSLQALATASPYGVAAGEIRILGSMNSQAWTHTGKVSGTTSQAWWDSNGVSAYLHMRGQITGNAQIVAQYRSVFNSQVAWDNSELIVQVTPAGNLPQPSQLWWPNLA